MTILANVVQILTYTSKLVIIQGWDELGGAGTAAACLAVAVTDGDISAREGIELARRVSPGAADTEDQERFVAAFEEHWRTTFAAWPHDYFIYWSEHMVEKNASNGSPLNFVACSGLSGVKQGDRL